MPSECILRSRCWSLWCSWWAQWLNCHLCCSVMLCTIQTSYHHYSNKCGWGFLEPGPNQGGGMDTLSPSNLTLSQFLFYLSPPGFYPHIFFYLSFFVPLFYTWTLLDFLNSGTVALVNYY